MKLFLLGLLHENTMGEIKIIQCEFWFYNENLDLTTQNIKETKEKRIFSLVNQQFTKEMAETKEISLSPWSFPWMYKSWNQQNLM